jgi:hypothetical protein
MRISVKPLFSPPVLLAIFSVFGSANVTPVLEIDSGFLSSEQIKATLIGNSVQHANSDSESAYTVYYPSYGTLIGAAGLWGLFKDQGRWSVTNGLYCAQWDKWQDNQQLCYRVALQSNHIHWIAQNTNREIIDQLIPGNPNDLD